MFVLTFTSHSFPPELPPKDVKDLLECDEPIKEFATQGLMEMIEPLKADDLDKEIILQDSPLEGGDLANFFKGPPGDGKTVSVAVVLDEMDEGDKDNVRDSEPGKCSVIPSPDEPFFPFKSNLQLDLLKRMEKEVEGLQKDGEHEVWKKLMSVVLFWVYSMFRIVDVLFRF